jgi:hypothetical protein
MSDRDRLIELLEDVANHPEKCCPHWGEEDCFNCPYDKGETCNMSARKADYLLANGVIVPPCKVGDTVYQIMDIESVHRQILELKVLRIEIEEPTIRFWCQTVKKYRYNFGELDIEDFGKTVFLTKEEAEEKLKELK